MNDISELLNFIGNNIEVKTLLWSGSGARGADTLVNNVDITGYTEFEIWVEPWSGGMSTPFRIGQTETKRIDVARAPYMGLRSFTTTSNSITCQTGKIYSTYGSSTGTDNTTVAVPVKIYGIKRAFS